VRERNLALLGVFLCLFLGALDQTIVSTALPRIVQDLGGTSLYAWVATSYLLASTVALPVAGRLADMVSPKWILLVSATVFLIGSALSGLSGSMDALIGFRALQGLGGGAIFAVGSTVIGLLFPPRERGRVQGLFGAVFGLASVVGPYLGGVLTDSFSWRYVFYVNMPVGAVALYVLLAHMPSVRVPRRQSFDTGGVVTLLLWTVPLLLALSWAGSTYAWTSPQVLGLLALSAVMLAAFYFVERRSAAALFDLSLLRVPTFTWAGIGTLFFGAAFLGSVLFLPFYLVFAKGVSPTGSGLALTPLTIGAVLGSVGSGQLASRLGRTKPILLVGNLWAAAVFFLIYAVMTVHLAESVLVVLMVLLGIGIGPGFPLYTLAVQNVVRREQLGVASSGNQFFRQIGSAIGAAVMGALLVSTLTSQITAHLPRSLRGSASAQGFTSNQLTSRDELKAKVERGFATAAEQLGAALRGDRAAYAALMASGKVPKAYRRLLTPGGIPAEVRQQTAASLALLERAMDGDGAARARVAASSVLPARVKALAAHPPAQAAARTAALDAVARGLRAAEPAVISRVERQVIPPAQAKLRAAGRTTAGQVTSAVTVGITDAVRNVFGLAGLLAMLAFLAGLLMPGLELRRQHAGADGPAEAGAPAP
jgi:EmrB/QacA subfamily drug resistance transporter